MIDQEIRNKHIAEVVSGARYDERGECLNIEYSDGAGYEKATSPNWNWNRTNYRLIPDPTPEEILAKFVKDNDLKKDDKLINDNKLIEIIDYLSFVDGKIYLKNKTEYIDTDQLHHWRKHEPQYVPFENVKELIPHFGKAIENIRNEICIFGRIDMNPTRKQIMAGDWYSFKEAFEKIKFINLETLETMPFGKLKED